MSLIGQIQSAISAIGAAVKSDRAQIAILERKTPVFGTASSGARTSIGVGNRVEIILTANGAAIGDYVKVEPNADLGTGANIAFAYVPQANKISVFVSNSGLGVLSIPAMNWNWMVWKK